MPFRSGLLALALVVATGCGSGPATFSSAQEAYDRGAEEFERGRFDRAVEYLRTALDFGRTSELADDAQLMLARAYVGDRQYLLAGNEFTRFIEFYRTDPRVEQAAYERIQAYAALSPRYELDQTDTRQALNYIRLYLQQYPESPNAVAAAELAEELREKLARKMYESGRLYERREMYEAAVLTYRDVLAEYPASEYGDDALLGAMRAQIAYADNSVPDRQAERYDEAVQIYQQLVTIFPQSPLLPEAEALYDEAYQGYRGAGGEETASGE